MSYCPEDCRSTGAGVAHYEALCPSSVESQTREACSSKKLDSLRKGSDADIVDADTVALGADVKGHLPLPDAVADVGFE